jgi:histone acetyltransferase (RNA polymerase elongator complex component)
MTVSLNKSLEVCDSDSFSVFRVDVESFPVILKTVEAWQQSIAAKQERDHSNKDLIQFSSCRSILQTVAICLNSKTAEHYQTIACVSFGNLQGIMQVRLGEESDLIVHTLVTNPNNIRAEQDQKQVRGVGTQLLRKAVQIAKESGRENLRLTPYRSAEAFYQKHGFTADESSFDMVKKLTGNLS